MEYCERRGTICRLWVSISLRECVSTWGSLGFEEIISSGNFSFTPCFCTVRGVNIMYESGVKQIQRKVISSVVLTSKSEWTWKL